MEDNIEVFRGVIINTIIRMTDRPRHSPTFCVDLENSTINIEEDDDIYL
jgi:hypothetical protein